MMLLEIRNVYKSFGGVLAAQDVSLKVNKGDFISLIGPNGAGKTTIFNLISGIYQVDSGNILFEEKEISGMEPSKIAHLGIARTFQNIRLFKGLTVLGNLLVSEDSRGKYSFFFSIFHLPPSRKADKENENNCIEILKLVGLEKYKNEDPLSLPYGLQRKVELARALASNPKLIMLDEPAAGLNPREVADFTALLKKLQEQFGFGILLIEHRMTLVNELSDKIYVLDFGKIIAEGDPDMIRNDPQVIKAYLGEEE